MTSGAAGEMMVDARGLFAVSRARLADSLGTHDSIVTREIIPIVATFFADDQFKGFSGSSGPFQSTIFGSFGAFPWVAMSIGLLLRTGWLCNSWLYAGWSW